MMSSNITAEDLLPTFRATFPEFDSDNDSRVTIYLNLAISIFCKCENAIIYLAAHLLSMADCSGMNTSGATSLCPGENQNVLPLSSAKVGQKQANFMKIASTNDSIYTTTNYGIIYLQLKKACLGYVFAAGVSGGC